MIHIWALPTSLGVVQYFQQDWLAEASYVTAGVQNSDCRNAILYIDANGTVTDRIKGFSKIVYYVTAIRHPFGRSPPIPVAEYITNAHDQFSIRQFLMGIHEKEYRRNRGRQQIHV